MTKPRKPPFTLLKPKPDVGASAKTKRRQRAGRAPSHKVAASSLANLRRGGRDLDIKAPPTLDAKTAAAYVKIRASGMPPEDALRYFTTTKFAKAQLAEILTTWETSPLVRGAWDAFNGACWEDLEKDARLELAIDHHLAQSAYFLMTTNFADKDAPLGKIRDARDAILKYLQDSGGNDAFAAFMQSVMDRVASTDGDEASGPPRLKAARVPPPTKFDS